MRGLIFIAFALILPGISLSQMTDSLIKKNSAPDTAAFRSTLDEVTITGKKAMVQILPDKTIVNVAASITATGSTLMEILEKSPGITVDRNGEISLKGKRGVMVMIDGKPAILAGSDLNNLLSGMSASQVEQIEIMDNPSAKYDAAGNAGVINIITKKNKLKGFNGNLNLSFGQGRYNKTFNTVSFNYYSGKLNFYLSAGVNVNNNFSDFYALRKYYSDDGSNHLVSILDQPSWFKGRIPSQNVKAGVDYFISPKTTLGLVLSGAGFKRMFKGTNTAIWKDAAERTDSVIFTNSDNLDRTTNGAVNLTGRHVFNEGRELTVDVNYLGYRIHNRQKYINVLDIINGYQEEIRGDLPSTLSVFSAKADYIQNIGKGASLEAGWKSSRVLTNNKAEYISSTDGGSWETDLGKTNHFIYDEQIHAAYATMKKTKEKWTVQGGLRYEFTGYDAKQLGNALVKDSSFSRKYNSLFPTATISVQADSLNNFSFSAGRRIDRPGFRSLNPFVYVINKYTYESGNPYYRPQYTWNTELSHSFKGVLVTSLGYSYTKDYFSQIFYADSTNIITYTEGNLEKMENFSLTVSSQLSPLSWWSFTAEAILSYKKIKGFVWDERKTALTQFNFNLNNQFNFKKGWSGELTGVYQHSEQELQEITDPTGQVGIGLAKQLLRNRATLKLSWRDIFYTQAMKGNTIFKGATEYFKITRDTRVVTLGFVYRFGSEARATPRRPAGGADDELKRIDGS